MGKYFSKETNLLNYDVTDENTIDTTSVIPSTDNLTQPLSNKIKEKLSQTRTPKEAIDDDDYINLVKNQTDQVTDMIQKYSESSKEEFKNHFKKFAPAELFEKINQLIFVVAQLNNKITNLEKVINGESIEKKVPIKITDPEELYKLQQQQEKGIKIEAPQNIPNKIPEKKISIEEIKNQLNDIKNGNASKYLPKEDYADNGINLEEIFPNLDDEAYQAAYASMNLNKKSKVEESKPTPGKMRGLTGF